MVKNTHLFLGGLMNIAYVKDVVSATLSSKVLGWVEVAVFVLVFSVFLAKIFLGKTVVSSQLLWIPLFVLSVIYFARVHGLGNRCFEEVSEDQFTAILALFLGLLAYNFA